MVFAIFICIVRILGIGLAYCLPGGSAVHRSVYFVHWIVLGHPLMVYCGGKKLNITSILYAFQTKFLFRSTNISKFGGVLPHG